MKRRYIDVNGRKVQVEGIRVGRPTKVAKVGRPFKYTVSQMRSYAIRSTSIKKQTYWMKKLYQQKATIAKKAGNTEQYAFYKERKATIKKTIKAKGVQSLKRTWKLAKTADDFEKLMYEGKLNAKQGKIIWDEDEGDKIFLYEGQDGYEEVLAKLKLAKKA